MIENMVLMNEMLRAQLQYTQSNASTANTAAEGISDYQNLKEKITKILSGDFTGNLQAFCDALSGSVNKICTDLYGLYLSAEQSKDSDTKKRQLYFYRNLSNQMEELIWLIRVLSPGNLSEDNIVPITIYLPQRSRLKKKSRYLNRLLPKLDNHSKPIIEIIQSAINHQLRPGNAVSFRTIQYLEELLEAIYGVEEDSPGTDINYRLHIKLIAYNFNHPKYIAYCNGMLEEKFSDLPAFEKIAKYSWYEMELRRIMPVPGKAFFTHLAPAQNSLLKYVSEEIKYLKLLTAIPPAITPDKIKLNLGVSEASLLLLGLSENAVVDEPNWLRFSHKISRFFSTVGADHISPESVRSNGFRHKPQTVVSLINKLLAVISWLRTK